MFDNEELKNFIQRYWNYYLRLEEDFYSTRNYVEFSEENFQTYSIEYLKLYLSICSEIDVVGKFLAKKLNPDFDSENANIKTWWPEISEKLTIDNKNLYEKEVNFAGISKPIKPWENFNDSNENSPMWWKTYNNVKHKRTEEDESTHREYYTQANLKNVISAFAGLYILEKAYINLKSNKKDSFTNRKSKIFEGERTSNNYVDGSNFFMEEKDVL